MLKCGTFTAMLVFLGSLSAHAAVTPDQCNALVNKIRPIADQCLTVADFQKRADCFDKVGSSLGVSDDTFKACQSTLDPVKQQYISKEKAKYPNQASAVDGNHNNNNNNNNGNGGPNGPNGGNSGGNQGPNSGGNQGSNMGHSNGPQIPVAVCKAEAPKIQKQAENCLLLSKFETRKACFDKIGNSEPPNFFDSCQDTMNPIKQALMAKEKSKYPNQASALDGGGNGPNNGSGGNGPGKMNGTNNNMNSQNSNVDCGKFVSTIRTQAMACLPNATLASRKSCFDKVGQSIDKSGNQNACQSSLDQLKQDIQSQEKAKYPSQASALQ